MPPIPELEAIRKAQILEAALKTISASGYANVTMDDICRAAGLSKGGLAHYYRSKNELFISVFKEFFERIFQRSKQTMELYENPIDKLLSFDWLYDRNDPDVNVGYPVLFDCMSLAVREKEYRSLFHDWFENWVSLLKDAIDDGLEKDIFRNLDSESTARAISSVYQGIATRWYLDYDSHPTEWAVESFKKAINGLLFPNNR
ncbi:MAG: TetR/AcrR family transcriptional regulator [Proteobacteria bacterium]|nr:TetR/AcrR family transcriptional regulator [Pseudomonadota bacterium]